MRELNAILAVLNRILARLERHAAKKTAQADQHAVDAAESTAKHDAARAEAAKALEVHANVSKLLGA